MHAPLIDWNVKDAEPWPWALTFVLIGWGFLGISLCVAWCACLQCLCLQHALRSQGDHGVRTSFTDFLQGKGKRCGKSSQRDFAGPKGAVSNECNNSGEMQGPYKGQAMRLFFPSKTIGKPGVGKGNGVQGKTNIERLGKGSNDSVLGRIKLSPWGPGHGGIAATTAIPMNKGYWAKSTLAVKMSRREEVTTLARMVAGQNQFLPLSKEVVEAVAAALKAAGLASADHYLNELKLLHVESGFHLEQWLARTFQLCKKSVVRERGPVKRAMEFQLEDVVLGGVEDDRRSGSFKSYMGICMGLSMDVKRGGTVEGVLGTHLLECGQENSETLHT